MGKQRTKLGARALSEKELEMILPNAETVFDHIDVFRRNITDLKETQEQEQRTNNIGIIGCRGAGKTSVLKTFKEKLTERNRERSSLPGGRDILLPLIVPENMSPGATLMDVILGMLKSQVEEMEKGAVQRSEDCIYSGRSNLLGKEYNNLVKQYCYIKEDYRDILIQQFTTEQNYVDKTKRVFNSDTEFIKLFREFVEHLLQGDRPYDPKGGDALLFLFIDDIDLSTTRCMDVVRTLLSYLSLPRIVTFISGDMETFEEALTLEFLRQEKALDKGVFDESYYSVTGKDGKLLERKKLLAYEYLKKIIPPAYRKEIKYWSLEERGAYRITEDGGEEQKNLAELMAEVVRGKLDESYFSYMESGKTKFLGPVFHMFDNTSRSLNNMYNVLQELHGQNDEGLLPGRGNGSTDKNGNTEKDEISRTISRYRRLFEALVDSKRLYSKYKEQLLQKIIIFEQDQVRIDLENAASFLYPLESTRQGAAEESGTVPDKSTGGKLSGEKSAGGDTAGRNSVGNNIAGKSIVEDRFAIFVLIDFAFQLFKAKGEPEKAYFDLKNQILAEYLGNDAIDGRIAASRKILNLQNEITSPFVIKLLHNLLTRGDFIFDIYFIRYLGRNEIYRIFEKAGKRMADYKKTDIYMAAYALARSLDAMCGSRDKRREYLADLYDRQPKTMLELLHSISSDPWMIYAEQLVPESHVPGGKLYFNTAEPLDRQYHWYMADKCLDNITAYVHEANCYIPGTDRRINTNCLWAERMNEQFLYWIYYERLKEEGFRVFDLKEISRKLVHEGIKSTTIRRLNSTVINDRYETKGLGETGYVFDESEDKKKADRSRAIMLIDDNGLWGDAYVKKYVGKYLEDEIQEYVNKAAGSSLLFDASGLMKKAYRQLTECEKGSSGRALIYGFVDRIKKAVALELYDGTADVGQNGEEAYCMELDHVLLLQCMAGDFINRHDRIRYGKREVRQFLAELRELPLLLFPERKEKPAAITERLEKLNRQFLSETCLLFGSRENPENQNRLDDIVHQSWQIYYEMGNTEHRILRDIVWDVVKKNFPELFSRLSATACYYIMYLVQKKETERLKERYFPDGSQAETLPYSTGVCPSGREYDFVFHSYLRYLQVNESSAAETGAEAAAVSELAVDLLESEGVSDSRMLGDIYERVGRQLDLTEEEFGNLF